MNSLVIFKNNLRINDNPVLFHSSKEQPIIPVYIHDNINLKKQIGSASKFWLFRALNSLNKLLDNKMHFYCGDTISIITNLINENSINKIYIEEPFIPEEVNLHNKLKNKLKKLNIDLNSYNCTLLWKPNKILKSDSTPYKVFTPFYKRGCLESTNPDKPLGEPYKIKFSATNNKTTLSALNLIDKYNWHTKLDKHWEISEQAAIKIFQDFIKKSIYEYKIKRDFPYLNKNSSLSPYIRFGMISIHRIWWTLHNLNSDKNIEHFRSELGWREFSYYLLNHFPYIEKNNFQEKFNMLQWENCPKAYTSWKKGMTGFPIIDAGMRELWETGFIHNRIRMVVGSFLVKNLSIDWRLGEKWFWDCLVDADYASNVASWQWVAGCGADAAPYFRIFNPILQGEKFDTLGKYTRKYVPELKKIPLEFLQKPWETTIQSNYPDPIVDYRKSRENALERYQTIK